MLQDLFKIGTLSSVDALTFSAGVEINQSHPVFGGHFPERPILPGVCSIHLIKECVGMATGREQRYVSITQCKFTGMVDPGLNNRLTVRFSLKREEGKTVVNGTIVNGTNETGERIVLKIKASMTETEAEAEAEA